MACGCIIHSPPIEHWHRTQLKSPIFTAVGCNATFYIHVSTLSRNVGVKVRAIVAALQLVHCLYAGFHIKFWWYNWGWIMTACVSSSLTLVRFMRGCHDRNVSSKHLSIMSPPAICNVHIGTQIICHKYGPCWSPCLIHNDLCHDLPKFPTKQIPDEYP